jgi:hypothetical protein
MANWFNRYSSPVQPKAQETKLEATPETAPEPDVPAYQVGVTETGKVTLRLGNTYGFTTLTMNHAGTRKLIQMLKAALEPTTDTVEGHDGRGPG